MTRWCSPNFAVGASMLVQELRSDAAMAYRGGGLTSTGGAGDRISLCDVELPALAAPLHGPIGPALSAEQQLYFYSSDQWEAFIREYAVALCGRYVQVKRFGGAGDRGSDVAAFKSEQGLEGPWDCYQGKHYAAPLMPSDAWPEVLKVMISVINGHYVMPDHYFFMAPRGCGPSLTRLLSKPSDMRSKFLERLDDEKFVSALDDATVAKVRAQATATDFSLFASVELQDMLETHRMSPHHSTRFGVSLPTRPAPSDPPDTLQAVEVNYVEQLLEVYREQFTIPSLTLDEVEAKVETGPHFRRQRVAFYRAESLRMYARDSVPEGTFESLQEEIYSGVVDVADAHHARGRDRLDAVLGKADTLQLLHPLVVVSGVDDRRGICHQLANDDRLRWVTP